MGASPLAASQMDGGRSLLNDLMQPPAGAAPVLNLGAMMQSPVANTEQTPPTGTGASSMEDSSQPATSKSSVSSREPATQDPARSLMGAIARGVLLQQQKQERELQVPCLLHILLCFNVERTPCYISSS